MEIMRDLGWRYIRNVSGLEFDTKIYCNINLERLEKHQSKIDDIFSKFRQRIMLKNIRNLKESEKERGDKMVIYWNHDSKVDSPRNVITLTDLLRYLLENEILEEKRASLTNPYPTFWEEDEKKQNLKGVGWTYDFDRFLDTKTTRRMYAAALNKGIPADPKEYAIIPMKDSAFDERALKLYLGTVPCKENIEEYCLNEPREGWVKRLQGQIGSKFLDKGIPPQIVQLTGLLIQAQYGLEEDFFNKSLKNPKLQNERDILILLNAFWKPMIQDLSKQEKITVVNSLLQNKLFREVSAKLKA